MLFDILQKDLITHFLIRLPSKSLESIGNTCNFFYNIVYNEINQKLYEILVKKYGCLV